MSSSFKEIKSLRYPNTELDILKEWKEKQVFEKSISSRNEGIPFNFYEGPPTANGKPGIHHVMARTVKDLFCRYKTLKGYKVERKAGWDTHGLPVEIEVEKALGLAGRSQVEDYGIAKYNAECRSSVLKYKDQWDELTDRMGYWVDQDNPYITFENDYIESVWWALSELYKKGLLYKGYKIQWYSPGNGTVLSSHEVSLGYKNTQDPSIYVMFPKPDEEETYYLAWTTTPWTTISNMALTINPELEYVKLAHHHKNYIVAKGCVQRVFGEEVIILEEFKGSELLGNRYLPIFDYARQDFNEEQAWKIIPASYVTIDDGTGIVHSPSVWSR